MTSLYAILEQPARSLVEALLNGSWYGVLVTLAVMPVLWALPRAGAATRYAILCVTLLAVALLPLIASLTDEVWSSSVAAALPASLAPHGNAQTQQPGNPDVDLAARLASTDVRHIWSIESTSGAWWLLAAGMWLLIVLARFCRIGWGVRELRHLKRVSHPLPSHYRALLETWSRAARARRTVEIRMSDSITTPMTVGFVHPVILLPTRLLKELSRQELAQVTVHELAHVRRYDDWTNLAQRLIEALLFFHPAVHWIARRMELERELACDDHVVATVTGERSYARCLTRLAELARTARPQRLAPGAAPTRSHLTIRVHALLSAGRHSTRISVVGCTAAGTLVVLSGGIFAHAAPMIALSEAISPPVSTVAEQPERGRTALNLRDREKSEAPHETAGDAPAALDAIRMQRATAIPASAGAMNSTRTIGRAGKSERQPVNTTQASIDEFESPVPQVAVVAPQVATSRGCAMENSVPGEEDCEPEGRGTMPLPLLTLQTQSAVPQQRGQNPEGARTAQKAMGVNLTITLALPDHASVDHPGSVVAGLSAFASAASRHGAGWQPNVGSRWVRDSEVPVRGRGIRLRVLGGSAGRGSFGRTLKSW